MTTATALAAHSTDFRTALGMLDPANSQAEAIDDIQALEDLKAACAAAQARRTAELAELRHAEEAARGVATAQRGKGLGAEVGFARGQSPSRGARYLAMASALTTELPHTMAALQTGQISEEHAQIVVTETSWLSSTHRTQVDTLIAEQLTQGGLGPRQLAGHVRGHAQRLDQAGAVARHEIARTQRRVTVRPAADGMAYLTALLPTPQAVGIYATLTRDASAMAYSGQTDDPRDPTGQPRTRDQIMADTLVRRATGQIAAAAVPAEVNLVMTDAALLGHTETSAWLTGHGPIPAQLARHWLANPATELALRRVFTRPEDHQLVALESRARYFPDGLRRMIALRDQTCRTPYCDAAVRHSDHATPHRDGGPTSWTNSSGLCRGCNLTKEHPGWDHDATDHGLTVTTPTGHHYTTNTGPVIPAIPPDEPPDEQPPTICNHAIRHPEPTITMRIAA